MDLRNLNDDNFLHNMTLQGKIAWLAFKDVTKNFLGNTKARNYEELVSNMLRQFQLLGCNTRFTLYVVILTIFLKILEQFAKNKVNVFIKISRQ